MDHELDIDELLQMEIGLEGESLSLARDAKVNLLKFLQVKTVKKYERAYDSLYHELNKDGGSACLRRIEELKPKSNLLQPKVLEPQGCNADEKLEKQLDFYREGAICAKVQLDKFVQELVNGHQGREGRYVEVKSLESMRRKATKSYGGDVRRLADMARVSVICSIPEDLELACKDLMESVEVRAPLKSVNFFHQRHSNPASWLSFGKHLLEHSTESDYTRKRSLLSRTRFGGS